MQNIFNNAQFAIQYVDDVLARKLLKEIEAVLSRGQNQFDAQTSSKLSDLRLRLSIVNFPNLSEEAAMEILRNHYLLSYDIGVDMENRITAMLFFYPEIPRDDLRKKLKMALSQNQEKLGGLVVGQWIQEFEKMFPVNVRELSASVRFSIEHPQARLLTPLDREKLKELLHVYDYLLVTTLPATGPVLEQILQAAPRTEIDGRSLFVQPDAVVQRRVYAEDSKNVFSQPIAKKFVQETLENALRKYPNVGEQRVSQDFLKLRIFSSPVRPSVKNWIADYQDVMGSKRHSPVDRGNFLFHSENGKKLTSLERQRVAVVLKSLDEEVPLTIDASVEAIVFEEMQDQSLTVAKKEIQNAPKEMGIREMYFSNNLPYQRTMASNDVQDLQSSVNPKQQFSMQQSSNVLGRKEFKNEVLDVEEKENFFQLPQSKPPIGTEHYDEERAQHLVDEKRNDFMTATHGAMDNIAPRPTLDAVKSQPEVVEIMARDFAKKTFQNEMHGESVLNTQTNVSTDFDSMSDDALFNILKEKKLKALQDHDQVSSGSVLLSDGISFSSAQKLPAEQEKNPIENINQSSMNKTNPFVQTPVQKDQRSSYRITPSDYSVDKKEVTPKVRGNVVDLKS